MEEREDVSLNPYTLEEEDEEERKERQRETGEIGDGKLVVCRPNPFDPEVTQVQHRAVCLTTPHIACPTCPHHSFTLVFKANPPNPYQLLSCPRWRSEEERLKGEPPEEYRTVERAFCSERPFVFCNQCPTPEEVEDLGADKVRPGWYGRWRRTLRELSDFDEEDDD